MSKKKRVIAINLPQFHPFKENDEWWGKGFTEWTNVTKSKPRYEGHWQPQLPSDTGFYDLRLPEARQMQADMAKEAGIYGFCYYHYWFNGKQLMERPVNEILASGEPDFPFMLCWANENWARNWDGGFKDVLMKQDYSHEDDIEHIRWLCKNVFSDRRYIRIADKPVFAVYRVALFPDFKETVQTWRKVAKEEFGMELYIIDTLFPNDKDIHQSISNVIDAYMEFRPIEIGATFLPQIKVKLYDPNEPQEARPMVYNYSDYVDYCCAQPSQQRCFPCISPGFDNSPRRVGRTFQAFIEQTPTNFGRWLTDALYRTYSFTQEDENLVFINAWNEWAEGNHLEPDQKWGRQYLDETKRVIDMYEHEDKPADYDAEIQKRYEILKEKVTRTSFLEMPPTFIYRKCKESIKDKNVPFAKALQLIKQAKPALSQKLYGKLLCKLYFYKSFKRS